MGAGGKGRKPGVVIYTHASIMPQCRDTGSMELTSLAEAPDHDPDRFVAVPFLDGDLCNVRVIRLTEGQTLPAHTHEPSELMLYVVEGDALLDTEQGPLPFPAGSLARYPGWEELRVSNAGVAPVTLLAFLTPPFPPR
jgi:redox-sensitive bicupin YhaK (pirin superfamily)